MEDVNVNEEFDYDGNSMGLSFDSTIEFDKPLTEEQAETTNVQEGVQESGEQEEQQPETPQLDAYQSLLDTMGFDYTTVENEQGEDVNFNDLSPDEKIHYISNAISLYKDTVSETLETQDQMTLQNALESDEKELLLEVRRFGGVQNYIDAVLNEGVQGSYDIDSVEDDELWLNHWKIQYQDKYKEGKVTDDMLNNKLEQMKKDPLFEEETSNLRSYYHSLEDKKAQEIQNQEMEKQQQAMQAELQKFQHEMIETARGIDQFMGVDVSQADFKNDVLSDIVEYDQNGTNEFLRTVLKDPVQMYRAAAFLKHGDAILNNIHEYYAGVIEEMKQSAVLNKGVDRNSVIDKRPLKKQRKEQETPDFNDKGNSLTEHDSMEF